MSVMPEIEIEGCGIDVLSCIGHVDIDCSGLLVQVLHLHWITILWLGI